jgi:peptidoglycan/LPS O-acetylase OafA/YrhL
LSSTHPASTRTADDGPGSVTRQTLPHFRCLDGLRGAASLLVLFHHLFLVSTTSPSSQPPLITRLLAAVLGYGYLGVDVFFVLSGFLITSLLLVDRENTAYFHNFYWKRVLRILPVYLVHLAITVFTIPGSWGYVLLSLFFIQNFSRIFHVFDQAGPVWTLSIEEQFYLLWPQVIRRLRLPSLYYSAFALIIGSVLLRLLPPLFHHQFNMRYTFFRCDGLALGAVLSLQWYSPEGRTSVIRAITSTLNSNMTLTVIILLQMLVLVRFPVTTFAVQATITCVNYLVYRAVRFLVSRDDPDRRGAFGLSSPVAVYFGSISYALYMYHLSIMWALNQYLGLVPLDHSAELIVRCVIVSALSVAAASLSRYALELPAQRLRRFVLRPSLKLF